ncbi:two-component system sensor histidine kinase YesM [Paenibacillus phyllosphaerae]|uniref:histidine kinase n=1 Tax=Paenibacillus phyllosphaerae TaxID=274593 RepID=A0A7W5ATC9_9BACL|nr:sensor histidine kinase [Paenibacillus phyllosphaerae]MBB3108323.1 two-component system sensor histidine kinase YesM [Paenibacillus phyllosphaerae]
MLFGNRRPLLPLFPLKSIQSSISFAFSCLILVTIVVTSLISYRLSVDAVEQNATGYIEEIIKQVNSNIQSYVDNMENISLLAMTNKDVKYYISDNDFISTEERRVYEKRISDLFQAILYTRQDIASIMVFGYNDRFVSDRRITSLNPNADVRNAPWYKSAKAAGGQSVISAPHVQNIIQNEYRWVVSLSRELRSTDGISPEGIFLVDLNLSVINDICRQINLGNKGYVFIVDQEGNIVYHPQQQLIYSGLASEKIDEVNAAASGASFTTGEGDGKRIYSVQGTNFGWKIVGVAYGDELIANKDTLSRSLFLYAFFGLAIALLLSVLLSHQLSRPIKNLQKDMKLVEKGNFDIKTEIGQMNEIGQLGRTFNMMVGQIKNLMEEAILTQEQKRKSELALLQSQINPHFLYNTLDSIIWMAEQKKHEEVVLMTSALAKLFRSSISKEKELVPIRVEIEHIKNYLIIQKMRYNNQLDYRLDIAPSIMMYRSLKILLQPFVENAIYHGIRNKPEMGLITIRGYEEEDRIVFEVEDDGLGMTEEKLEMLLEPVGGSGLSDPLQSGSGGKGIGISNVNERIKLFFGEPYGIQIRSELEVGTCVTIIIPKLD